MKRWHQLLAAFLVAAGFAGADEIDSGALLSRVQEKVRENARTIPKFICRQKIERQEFDLGRFTRGCKALGEHELDNSGRRLVTSDRATLDVMLSEKSELFAWPGARSFDVDNPDVLLGGGLSGSGDFATYVMSIFTQDAVTFEYQGPCERAGCVRFSYDVPQFASTHTVRTTFQEATLGYHGTFDVDPQSADLLSLTVIPTDLTINLSEACDMRTRMTYSKTTSDAGEFMIPQSTVREYVSRSGEAYRNRASYESCREYSSESTLSFGDQPSSAEVTGKSGDPAPLPVRSAELQLRLAAGIRSDGSAGDGIEAALVRAVRDRQGHMIPAGTVFRGYITRLLQVHEARHPQVILSIRLNAIVFDGMPVSITLNPVGKTDSHGQAVFSFPGTPAVIGQGLVSRWKVVS